MSSNVAVIGCGYWGKNLVRVFSQIGVLKCVCDRDVLRQDAIAFEGDPPKFTESLQDVLDDESINAVAVATPAATHFDVVTRCLKAGKDVFVEKPLALDADEGQRLVELAKKESRILMVGHILLYHPAVTKLRELIEEGELGRILYCYSNRLNMGLIRTEENILWSFAPHDISVMLHLLGEEPVSVEADGQSYLTPGVVDVTLSRMRFKSGVTGHIFVSWLHPSKEQKLVVVGTEKMAIFDDTSENKLVLYPHRVDWADRLPKAVKGEATVVKLEKAEPLKQECLHFLDCVESREAPVSDGNEGLRVLRVLDRCQQSLEQAATGDATAETSAASGDYFAHETACIDQPCSIGEGTKIWNFSHVLKGAVIGKNCSLGQNVVVAGTAVIGDGVKIQNNISIYDGVVIGDGVFCGPSMVFTNVMNPRSEVSRKHEYQKTIVEQGATFGANCTIVCGNAIGRYAFIGAGAVVTKDVPPYALVVGNPAKQVGWMCRCAGEQLTFDAQGDAKCSTCGQTYRLENDCVREEGVSVDK